MAAVIPKNLRLRHCFALTEIKLSDRASAGTLPRGLLAADTLRVTIVTTKAVSDVTIVTRKAMNDVTIVTAVDQGFPDAGDAEGRRASYCAAAQLSAAGREIGGRSAQFRIHLSSVAIQFG